MKTLAPEELERARNAAHEISELLASIEATEDLGEREQRTDILRAYVAPAPGHSLVNLASEIVQAKIDQTKEEFLAATAPFYRDASVANRAAESCEAVAELNHLLSSIGSSPSVEQANRLLKVFTETVASVTPPGELIGLTTQD